MVDVVLMAVVIRWVVVVKRGNDMAVTEKRVNVMQEGLQWWQWLW